MMSARTALPSPIKFLFSLTESVVVIRYLAEFKTDTERKDAAESTMVAYKAAQVIILF
jgi:hypothetical protein